MSKTSKKEVDICKSLGEQMLSERFAYKQKKLPDENIREY